jgi:hypothetical protein
MCPIRARNGSRGQWRVSVFAVLRDASIALAISVNVNPRSRQTAPIGVLPPQQKSIP